MLGERRGAVEYFGALVLAGLGLQVGVIFSGLMEASGWGRALFVFSYFLLLAFVVANWRRWGIALIGLGLLLNLLPIVTNGGAMPITPAAVERAGLELQGVQLGDIVPGSKNVLQERGNTRLWPLSDLLVWKNPTPLRVFSVGDVIVAAGLLVTLSGLAVEAGRRRNGSNQPGASG